MIWQKWDKENEDALFEDEVWTCMFGGTFWWHAHVTGNDRIWYEAKVFCDGYSTRGPGNGLGKTKEGAVYDALLGLKKVTGGIHSKQWNGFLEELEDHSKEAFTIISQEDSKHDAQVP